MKKLAPLLLALVVLTPGSARAADMVLQKTVLGGITWLTKAFNIEQGPFSTLKLFKDNKVVCKEQFMDVQAFGDCVAKKAGKTYWKATLKEINKVF